jgi:hypothetical protein
MAPGSAFDPSAAQTPGSMTPFGSAVPNIFGHGFERTSITQAIAPSQYRPLHNLSTIPVSKSILQEASEKKKRKEADMESEEDGEDL